MSNPSFKTVEDWIRIEKFVGNVNPDPAKCPIPQLLPGNVLPMEIFQLVRDQYIVAGLGTVVGINKVALLEVMKLYEAFINDPIECFEKCCVLAQIEVARIQEMSKSKDDK